jgi:DNA-binding response OmpR family regulator
MGSAFSRRFRILMVSPDAELQRAARDAFGEKGLDVEARAEPSALDEDVVRMAPDLILLDADIPGFDARDAVCVLKVDPRTNRVPIVLMSGVERHWGRSFALEIGAEEYLDKPLALRSVSWRLRSHLETRAKQELVETPYVESFGDTPGIDGRPADLFRAGEGERAAASKPPRARRSDRPILIVEDDEDLREVLTHILESEGLTTLSARNGQEALDILHTQGVSPGLILLDLMMPIMNGWEFREKVDTDTSISDVPVVVMSARSRDDSLNSAAWLEKPLRVDELLNTVQQVALAS